MYKMPTRYSMGASQSVVNWFAPACEVDDLLGLARIVLHLEAQSAAYIGHIRCVDQNRFTIFAIAGRSWVACPPRPAAEHTRNRTDDSTIKETFLKPSNCTTRVTSQSRHILLQAAAGLLFGLAAAAANAAGTSILFIGNSFTYAHGSPVRFYRADSVTDLNSQGIGGMPALFKAFTMEAGLDYDVYIETEPGIGIDWHLEHKLGVIGQRPFDEVVMHGFSTLDPKKPGDPAVLIDSARQMTAFLRARNASVQIYMMATWPRADQTYEQKGGWYGKPIEAMAHDVRAGYDQAFAAIPGLKPVVPVGEAWIRAMQTGVADSNPYDGIDAGKLDLWTYDNYHASTFGYYLEALVVFGSVTGRDPRSLGENECSGFELGLSPAQVNALEQVAFDQLAVSGAVKAAPLKLDKSTLPVRCVRSR
jgi:hypothetical protein